MQIPQSPGWIIQPGPVVPTHYQVFGERSSGTNFLRRLIGRNSRLQPTDALGWKHGFPQMVAIPPDLLVVCVVRDARRWALSMHRRPWHCPPDMQRLDFPAFIRAPWDTVADRRRYFPQLGKEGGVGAPLQLDRHPLTGERFAHLPALRNAKISGLLSYFQRGCALSLMRLEAVQDAPEAFLDDLHATLRLAPPHTPYRPVLRRLGARFKPAIEDRPATPESVPAEDLAFLRDTLDDRQEARLGYAYD